MITLPFAAGAAVAAAAAAAEVEVVFLPPEPAWTVTAPAALEVVVAAMRASGVRAAELIEEELELELAA